MEITAKEIQRIRKDLNLSREQFAQLLSVSYKTICRWETEGIRSISNSSSGKLLALRKILSSKKGNSTIKELLSSTPGIMGVAALSSMIPILGNIIGLSVLVAPAVLKAINHLLENSDNDETKKEV